MLHTIPLGIVSSTAAAYLLEQSLLFDGSTTYLSRTPSVAGNRKTGTISVWVKRANLGNTGNYLLGVGTTASGDYATFYFDVNDRLVFQFNNPSSICNLISTAVFRDTSSWIHIVLAYDTTQATASDRVKLYANGVQITAFDTETYPTLNFDCAINKASEAHVWGAPNWYLNPTVMFDGLMALPQLVDGAALDASSFGELDDDGYWNPIEFTGATTTDANYSATVTAPNFGTDAEAILGSDGDKTTIYDVQPGALASVATSGRIAIKMDFGSAVTVTMAAITAKITAGSGFRVEIYYSSDASTWTQFNSTYANLTSSYQDFATTGSQSARYWAATFSAGNHGSQTVTISDFRVFTDNGDSFGTNGGAYDFADNTLYGLDVKDGDAAAAYTISASGLWTGGSITYTSDSIQGAAGDEAAYVTSSVSSANFPANFSAVPVGTLDNAGSTTGLFDAAEIGTFNDGDTGGNGGLDNMTKSWSIRHSDGQVRYGSSVVATVAVALNKEIKWDIAADGTVTVFGSTTSHTFTQKADGISIHWAFGVSNPSRVLENVRWIDSASGTVGNNFRGFNFTTTDQLADTPTDSSDDSIGNFATLNPNDDSGSVVLSEGNLKATIAPSAWHGIRGTIGVNSGKVYFEVTDDNGDVHNCSGMASAASILTNSPGTATQNSLIFNTGDFYEYDGTTTASTATTTGQIRGHAVDLDAGKAWYAINNTWQNSGNPSTAANPIDSSLPTDETLLFPVFRGHSSSALTFNFGQKPFAYTPPTGFSAIATQNLPAPTISDGSQQFTPVIYTGTGSELAITSLDFTPDFVWIKNRDATDNHMLYDSIRGATKDLHSNTTAAETTTAQTLKSFDSAGFTLGTDVQVNTNTEDYVAWCWKAGGSASSNTDGSITTSVSVNTTSGFSIISYTGNATAGATLGHGLSSAPKFIIGKNRDNGANNWGGYHVSLGGTHRIFPDNTTAAQNDDGNWNDTNPTASVITLGNGGITNSNTDDFIMYAWAEVEGFSKFGSLNTTGGTADNSFVYTGFRPSLVMIKRTDSAGNWFVVDNTRPGYNPNNGLSWNTTNAEFSGASTNVADLLSNGFKVRFNAGTATYIYAAFAEQPFQGADGVTQARAR